MGVKILQTNFTSGVWDPRLAAREDISFFFNAVEEANNIIIEPQGGCRRRGGLKHIRELTNQISELDLSSATLTATNGGTAANLIDDDEATELETSNDLSTTDPFVVAHIDLGAAGDVAAIDIINYRLASGAVEDEFFIQYSSDDSNWSNYGSAFDISAANRTRRRRDESALSISARYWRLVRIGFTDVAAHVFVGEIKMWQETSDLSEARLTSFSYDVMTVLSDRNADVFVNENYLQSFPITHTSDQLSIINATQSLDTMFLFHPDVAPPIVFRQGDNDEFDVRNIEFEALPKYDYGAGTGGVNEVQVLNDANSFDDNSAMTILLEGERTATIYSNASRALTAVNIENALRALSNTSNDGITVTASFSGFTVNFSGADGGRPWQEMSINILVGNAVIDVSRTTKGELPGEDIISNTQGWPRDGAIYQQRLNLVGMKGVPDAHMASKLGDFFNFEVDDELEDGALLFRPDSDQVPTVNQIFVGRHLTLFADDSEFYYPSVALDKDAFPVLTTRTGIKEGVRPFEVDGAILFVQIDGSSLREFIFTDTEQSYSANPISVLSSHLIKNPVDAGLRRALNTNETDLLVLVNEDGSGVFLSTLRSQNVTAFTPFNLRSGDKILSVGVDRTKRVYFVVERIISGTARRFIEKLEQDLLLDGGDELTMTYENFTAIDAQTDFTWSFDNPASAEAIGVRINGARLDPNDYDVDLGTKTISLDDGAAANDVIRVSSMVKVISGLDHLADETIQTYIDGSPGDDYVVSSSGVLTLGDYADTSIQYGFFFDVSGKLMPIRFPESETLSGEKLRVYRVLLSLFETGHIELKANGGKWRDIPLVSYDDDILDQSSSDLLFTGEKDIKGFSGWAEGGYVEFRQTRPGPMTIRSITREVNV